LATGQVADSDTQVADWSNWKGTVTKLQHHFDITDFINQLEKLIHRGSRSDRLRYHAYMRWTPPLPLASAAPRCTPRRAGAQLAS